MTSLESSITSGMAKGSGKMFNDYDSFVCHQMVFLQCMILEYMLVVELCLVHSADL